MAVEVYIRLSRGVEILPPDLSAKIKPSRVANYMAKTPLLKAQAGPELQRHFDKKFVEYWDVLKKQHPDIGEPHNIHVRALHDAVNASKKVERNFLQLGPGPFLGWGRGFRRWYCYKKKTKKTKKNKKKVLYGRNSY